MYEVVQILEEDNLAKKWEDSQRVDATRDITNDYPSSEKYFDLTDDSSKRWNYQAQDSRYLARNGYLENPRYIKEGVRLSQFSFQTPKPLQEKNYVNKRPARPALQHDGNGPGASRFVEPFEVNPITWVSPVDTEFHHEDPKLSNGDVSRAELSNEQKRRKA